MENGFSVRRQLATVVQRWRTTTCAVCAHATLHLSVPTLYNALNETCSTQVGNLLRVFLSLTNRKVCTYLQGSGRVLKAATCPETLFRFDCFLLFPFAPFQCDVYPCDGLARARDPCTTSSFPPFFRAVVCARCVRSLLSALAFYRHVHAREQRLLSAVAFSLSLLRGHQLRSSSPFQRLRAFQFLVLLPELWVCTVVSFHSHPHPKFLSVVVWNHVNSYLTSTAVNQECLAMAAWAEFMSCSWLVLL